MCPNPNAPVTDESGSAETGGRITARATQGYLVAGSRCLLYLTRTQLGVLLPLLTTELGLSHAEQGVLMSRYAQGYVLTQIAGGILADRIGGLPVLAVAALISGLSCLVAPTLATSWGSEAFGGCFFVLGVVQGAAYPAGNVICTRWCLPSERSWATSLAAMGLALGSFLINAGGPVIAAHLGWKAVLYTSAALCALYLIALLLLGASSPMESKRVSDQEFRVLRSAGLVPPKAAKPAATRASHPSLSASPSLARDGLLDRPKARVLPPSALFCQPSVWVIFLANLVHNCQMYFMEWLPLFYTSHLKASPEVAGALVAAVVLVDLPARLLTAGLPTLLSKRMSLLGCRKFMSYLGFGGNLLLSLLLAGMLLFGGSSAASFTVVLALSKATQAFHAGGYLPNYLDTTAAYSGALSGMGNTLSTCVGVLFPRLVSWSLDTLGNGWLFLVVGLILMNVVTIVAVARGMSATNLDAELEAADKLGPPTPKGMGFVAHYVAISSAMGLKQ